GAVAQEAAPSGQDVIGAGSAVIEAAGSDSLIQARASRLASELRCPVCQGLSIGASPTPQAAEMREIIVDQLRAGRTDEEIRQYFVDRYGEFILLQPRARGFNLIVYLLPWLAVAGGLGLIVLLVRRWTQAGSGGTDGLEGEEADAASVPERIGS